MLEEYERRYGPNGRFSIFARERLAELTAADNAPAPAAPAPPATASLTEAAFNNTVWHMTCQSCTGTNYWIALLPSGQFTHSTKGPSDFKATDQPSTWRIEGMTLILSWNGGFATDTITFAAPDARRANGSWSNKDNVKGTESIERVR
jgi:hypothetical protein